MKYTWNLIFLCIIVIGIIYIYPIQFESFQTRPKEVLLIRGNQPYASIFLEIATTPTELQKGLMYRTELAPNSGMLFVFPTESPQSFWMRNTLIPLDMVFVKGNGRIVTIHQNTTTQSDQQYPSTEPAKYGIELPAGTVKRLGIRHGDAVGI